MKCKKCGLDRLRRIHRRGFLQSRIFPLLALYPWECEMCRKVSLHSRRVRKSDSAQSADAAERVNSFT